MERVTKLTKLVIGFFKHLFGMETENTKNFKRAAYHESGHIVLTYMAGYSCDSVELLTSEPGTGFTKMNYGQDLLLITSITNCKTDPDIFNELDNSTKSKSPGVANKIATILLAGSASEAVHLNNGQINGTMNLEISGPDLIRVENVHFFLSQINSGHNSNFIQETLHDVLHIIGTPNFWTAIEKLSKKLLDSSNKKLDKKEIEDILTETGLLDFIKKNSE